MRKRTDRTVEWFCVLMVAIGTGMASPKMFSDNTEICARYFYTDDGGLLCRQGGRPQATTYLDWWDVSCSIFPWGSWCPPKVKDPKLPPEPKTLTPDPPPCDIMGPCQQ